MAAGTRWVAFWICMLTVSWALARPHFPFELLSAMGTVTSAAVADFDGDGRADIAYGFSDRAGIGIFLNRGDGGFERRVYEGAPFPTISGIAAGDVNGDGRVDLVALERGHDAVVLTGRGDGTFEPASRVALTADFIYQLGHVRLGDLDGDSGLDAVIAAGNRLFVLVGDGSGSFELRDEIATPADVEQLELADVDDDGFLDVLHGTAVPGLETRAGRGDGTFEQPRLLVPDVDTFARTDVDGDGLMDLVGARAGYPESSLVVAAGVGRGSFLPAEAVASAFRLRLLAAGDYDGDGDIDVIGKTPADDFLIFRGRGDRTFDAAVETVLHPAALSATNADLDGDRKSDLLIVHDEAPWLTIALGDTTSVIRAPRFYHLPRPGNELAATDVDADGDIDALVLSDYATPWLNDGTGALTPGTGSRLRSANGATSWADFDGDGLLDFARGDGSSARAFHVYRNTGHGVYEVTWGASVVGVIYGLVAADFDGDARVDVIAFGQEFNGGGHMGFARGRGDGTFGALVWSDHPPVSVVSAADVDGDGATDLLIRPLSAPSLSWSRGRGDGTFEPVAPTPCGEDVAAVLPFDGDRDGDSDLLCAHRYPYESSDTELRALERLGDGTFAEHPLWSGSSAMQFVSLADVSGDGIDDVVLRSGVYGLMIFEATSAFEVRAPRAYSGDLTYASLADLSGDGLADIVGLNYRFLTVHANASRRANSPPVAASGADRSAECSSPGGAAVRLDGSDSSDPDGDALTFAWSAPGVAFDDPSSATPTGVFPLGVTSVTLAVSDGQDTATDEVIVTVVDTIPPEIGVAATPATLWPPNHELREIGLDVVARDLCDPNPVVRLASVSSSEPEDGSGRGDLAPDVWGAEIGTADMGLELRAERAGTGGGRVYTVAYVASDVSKNWAAAAAEVSVPHDERPAGTGRR